MRACTLLHDLLADSVAAIPDGVALVCGTERVTYAELARRVHGLAAQLVACGVERGDRVVVFAENSLDVAIAFWATLEANAVVSIVHPQTKADKLAYVLEDSRARVLITQPALSGTATAAAARSRHLAATLVGIGSHVADAPPARRCIDVDLAAIVYTSGSTGEPKGVMLSHRNMLAANASISEYLGIRRDDVILCALPLAFDYGLYQMIMAFAAGARLVLERSFAFPMQVMTTVVAERVTGFPGVPTMFAQLLNLKAAFDLSAVRYVTNTAAALPPKQIPAIQALFGHAQVFSMYGLTECKRCTYVPPAMLAAKPDSVGIAIPNTELWIVDEHGERLGPGQVGELVIRGATVMQGYWEKPEATARKLRPGPLPGERVLYTGDLCRLDDDGYLYFVARMDEVIKSRGEKVPPKEVESTLLSIEGVREAAVIGVPDELLGAAIKAFVVPEPGVILDVAMLQRACRDRLESFKVPTHIELRDALPKSSNGKIQKSELA